MCIKYPLGYSMKEFWMNKVITDWFSFNLLNSLYWFITFTLSAANRLHCVPWPADPYDPYYTHNYKAIADNDQFQSDDAGFRAIFLVASAPRVYKVTIDTVITFEELRTTLDLLKFARFVKPNL